MRSNNPFYFVSRQKVKFLMVAFSNIRIGLDFVVEHAINTRVGQIEMSREDSGAAAHVNKQLWTLKKKRRRDNTRYPLAVYYTC